MTRMLMVLGACLSGLACTVPYAKLDGVVAGGRPAPAAEPPKVTLVRDGEPRAAAPDQSFVPGDSMRTAADGVALLTLRAGYEVIVEPGSEISVENPSIFVKVGKLFLRRIRQTRERLKLNTTFVSAGVEGTEFVFEVTSGGAVHLTVLEGRVVLSSRTMAWADVTYAAGQSVTISGGAPPGPVQVVEPPSIRSIRERVASTEQAAQYHSGQPWSRFTPFWKKPAFLVPAAVAVAGAAVLITTGGTEPHGGTVIISIPF